MNGETLLDFNRAGTPLVEVVTDPGFHSADEVHAFIREIQRTLTYYAISLAEMDK
jgi:aspartyl-tRNA(Asn)/glutamyl-tRNA(Gln) amidotransferase subunit B